VLIVARGPAAEVRTWWRIMRRISKGREVNLKEDASRGGVVLDFLDRECVI
jgi:hypothetical protein